MWTGVLGIAHLTDRSTTPAIGDFGGRQLPFCLPWEIHGDAIAKLSLVEEEADESLYRMELLRESGILPDERLQQLVSEANEILAMTVASIKTLRLSRASSISNPKSKI